MSFGQSAEPPICVLRPGTTDLPGHRLHQLVDVGVGEHHSLVIARVARGGAREVVDPAETLHPLLTVGERRLGVHRLPGRPLSPGDLDLTELERA